MRWTGEPAGSATYWQPLWYPDCKLISGIVVLQVGEEFWISPNSVNGSEYDVGPFERLCDAQAAAETMMKLGATDETLIQGEEVCQAA